MKTALIIPRVENEPACIIVSRAPASVEKTKSLELCVITDLPKNHRKPYCKFYKVINNDTAVAEVFTSDFKVFGPDYLKIKTACNLHSMGCLAFSLPDKSEMFYGSLSRIKAMEHAKADALKYITKLIEGGESSYDLLLKYRQDHYDDLNVNLTDRNIRKLEIAMGIYSN
jgi:hypothetical protein